MWAWAYCWCNFAPRGSWWTPDELPAYGSAAPQPPSSDAGQSVGSRNPGTCPNLAHIARHLETSQRRQNNQTSECLNRFPMVFWVFCVFITQNIDTTFKQLTRSNFHCKKRRKKAHQSDRSSLRMLASRDSEPDCRAQYTFLHWDRGHLHRHLKQNSGPVQINTLITSTSTESVI